MIDTVNYLQVRKVRWGIAWRFRNVDSSRKFPNGSDLRIRSPDGKIVEVEVSLPKLLFGTNKKLIHTQNQIAKALAKADKIVNKFCEPTDAPKEFSRVDLVWHFPSCPPEYFFLAHQNCTHEEVRTRVFTFYQKQRLTGIQWQGGKTMHIKMYDKTNWELLAPRQVVRVEIMLKWDRLRKKFTGKKRGTVTDLDLQKCYLCYRSALLKFHPKPVPKIAGKDLAICYAESEGLRVIDLFARKMSNGQVKSLRKKAAAHAFDHYKIDWPKFLPENSLPTKFDAGELKCPTKFRFQKKMRKSSHKTSS